jgi:hypothetical protein
MPTLPHDRKARSRWSAHPNAGSIEIHHARPLHLSSFRRTERAFWRSCIHVATSISLSRMPPPLSADSGHADRRRLAPPASSPPGNPAVGCRSGRLEIQSRSPERPEPVRPDSSAFVNAEVGSGRATHLVVLRSGSLNDAARLPRKEGLAFRGDDFDRGWDARTNSCAKAASSIGSAMSSTCSVASDRTDQATET